MTQEVRKYPATPAIESLVANTLQTVKQTVDTLHPEIQRDESALKRLRFSGFLAQVYAYDYSRVDFLESLIADQAAMDKRIQTLGLIFTPEQKERYELLTQHRAEIGTQLATEIQRLQAWHEIDMEGLEISSLEGFSTFTQKLREESLKGLKRVLGLMTAGLHVEPHATIESLMKKESEKRGYQMEDTPQLIVEKAAGQISTQQALAAYLSTEPVDLDILSEGEEGQKKIVHQQDPWKIFLGDYTPGDRKSLDKFHNERKAYNKVAQALGDSLYKDSPERPSDMEVLNRSGEITIAKLIHYGKYLTFDLEDTSDKGPKKIINHMARVLASVVRMDELAEAQKSESAIPPFKTFDSYLQLAQAIVYKQFEITGQFNENITISALLSQIAKLEPGGGQGVEEQGEIKTTKVKRPAHAPGEMQERFKPLAELFELGTPENPIMEAEILEKLFPKQDKSDFHRRRYDLKKYFETKGRKLVYADITDEAGHTQKGYYIEDEQKQEAASTAAALSTENDKPLLPTSPHTSQYAKVEVAGRDDIYWDEKNNTYVQQVSEDKYITPVIAGIQITDDYNELADAIKEEIRSNSHSTRLPEEGEKVEIPEVVLNDNQNTAFDMLSAALQTETALDKATIEAMMTEIINEHKLYERHMSWLNQSDWKVRSEISKLVRGGVKRIIRSKKKQE